MSLSMVGPVPIPKPQTTPLTIVVTGASRGLGHELVLQYAKAHKDNVIIAGVRDPSSTSVKKFSAYPNVHVVQLDVSNEASVRASVKEAERFIQHLDVLVNNAGVYGETEAADPLKATAAQLNQVFNINVVGAVVTTQTYIALLRKSANAKVINVSSGLGSNALANLFGQPTLTYGVSKAALNYVTTVFHHAEPQVMFISINPGWVETDMGKAAGKAPTKIEDSIQALRYYIAEKTLANSGEFLDIMSGNLIEY